MSKREESNMSLNVGGICLRIHDLMNFGVGFNWSDLFHYLRGNTRHLLSSQPGSLSLLLQQDFRPSCRLSNVSQGKNHLMSCDAPLLEAEIDSAE